MSVPTVLQTGNSCLVEMNTTIPLGNGYLGHQNGEGGRPVYIEIYDHAFWFSREDATWLHPKMSKARQQENRETVRELDRFSVHIINIDSS